MELTNEKVEQELVRLPQEMDSLNDELLKKEQRKLELVARKMSIELRVKRSVIEEVEKPEGDKKAKPKPKYTNQGIRDAESLKRLESDAGYQELVKEDLKLLEEINIAKKDLEFIRYSHRSYVAIAHMRKDGTTINIGGKDDGAKAE